MIVKFGPDLDAVIAVLQTALTPAFLLVSVGSLLNILTGRLSRIVDRSRDLQDRHAATQGQEHDRLVTELRVIEKRMRVVGSSILLSVLSALTVCLMIGLLFLMGAVGFLDGMDCRRGFHAGTGADGRITHPVCARSRTCHARYLCSGGISGAAAKTETDTAARQLTVFTPQFCNAGHNLVADCRRYELADLAAIKRYFLDQP